MTMGFERRDLVANDTHMASGLSALASLVERAEPTPTWFLAADAAVEAYEAAIRAELEAPEYRTAQAMSCLAKLGGELASQCQLKTPPERLAGIRKITQALDDARAASGHRRHGEVLGVRALDVDDIFSPLPPTRWISRDLQWCPGRPSVVVGYGGSGKTLAVQSAALSIAVGGGAERKIWGQFPVNRRAKVLHLDVDNGRDATKRRYQRLALGMNLDPSEIRGCLRVIPYPRVRLTSDSAFQEYRAAVDGWDVCILDALRGFTPGIDENDSRIRDFIDILSALSDETGCTFVLIHHEGKGGEGRSGHEAGRGSSAIFDASGATIRIACENIKKTAPEVDDESGQTPAENGPEVRRVSMTKAASEAPGADLRPFRLVIEDVAFGGEPKAGARVAYQSLQGAKPARGHGRYEAVLRRVLAHVESETRAGRHVTGNSLRVDLKMNRSDAYVALRELGARGQIVDRAQEGNQTRWFAVSPTTAD